MYQLLLSLILALQGLSNVGPKNPTPNSTCHAEGAERPKDLGRGYPFPPRSFAEFILSNAEGLRMTLEIVSQTSRRASVAGLTAVGTVFLTSACSASAAPAPLPTPTASPGPSLNAPAPEARVRVVATITVLADLAEKCRRRPGGSGHHSAARGR
jgi:hypothetical protein